MASNRRISPDDPRAMLCDPNTIVFVNGHEVGCEHRATCDCDDRYIALFNRCPECAAELDEYGECPDEQEHIWWDVKPRSRGRGPLMAVGSEPMSWKVWPYGKECDVCGKTLRIQDVGEHRTIYQQGKAVKRILWCKEHRGGS